MEQQKSGLRFEKCQAAPCRALEPDQNEPVAPGFFKGGESMKENREKNRASAHIGEPEALSEAESNLAKSSRKA